MKILFQGDSITDTLRTSTPNCHLGMGYVHLVAARLYADYRDKDIQVINRGISGNRIVDLYARWKCDAINLKPDVLSIMIGVNDTWHEFSENPNGVEVPRYDRIYRDLIEWTKKELPDTKIILITPYVLPANEDILKLLPEVQERQKVVEQIAKDYGLALIKLHEVFDEALKTMDCHKISEDGVHPVLAGHQIIADEWIKKFKELV